MRIECVSGPVITEVMGMTYRFEIDADGRCVAEVNYPKHIAAFLAVADHYRAADAVPTIASIDPTEAEVGSADVTLTVTGTNFTNTSVIVFNGGDEPTDFVSDTEVSTVVRPQTASGPITVPIHVRTEGMDSNAVEFSFIEAAPEPDPETSHRSSKKPGRGR